MSHFRFTPIACLLLIGSLAAAEIPEGSWPQWRGPNRDGQAPATDIRTDWDSNPPELLWKSEGIGNGYASLSIVGDHIYTTGNLDDGQYVFASATDGRGVIWKTRLTNKPPKHGYQGSRTTPTVDGDQLYLVTSDGQIFSLNRKTGKILWEVDFKESFDGRMSSGWGYSESPLVDGDLVICTPGGRDAMLVALNKNTGDTVWTTPLGDVGGNGKGGAAYSSPVISNAAGIKQYVQLVGQGVIGVRASDGELLWGYSKVANGVANIPTPLAVGNYVFCSSGYGTGAALLEITKAGRGVNAREVYFLDPSTFQCHHGGMLYKDGYIYAGTGHNQGFPICLEMKTGEVQWGGKLRGVGKKSAAVTMVDDHIIFRYQSGQIGLVEATPKEYRLKGSFTPVVVEEPSWSAVVVVDSKLYFRENGTLMCYDVSE